MMVLFAKEPSFAKVKQPQILSLCVYYDLYGLNESIFSTKTFLLHQCRSLPVSFSHKPGTVTRFDEILPLGQNFKSLWQFLLV